MAESCAARLGIRRIAVVISIVLHGTLLYAATHIAWSIPDTAPRPPTPVLWLDTPPRQMPAEEYAPDRPKPRLDEVRPAEIDRLEPPREPSDQEADDRRQRDVPPEAAKDDALPAVGPGGEGITVIEREVDWEIERERVIARALELLNLREGDRDFSAEERAAERAANEAAELTERLFDECPVVKNRFARLAMRMTGRCFRSEAHGDLFAQFKPDYLRKRPVCTEHEIALAMGTSDGDAPVHVTKCRLVPIEEFDVPPYMAR